MLLAPFAAGQQRGEAFLESLEPLIAAAPTDATRLAQLAAKIAWVADERRPDDWTHEDLAVLLEAHDRLLGDAYDTRGELEIARASLARQAGRLDVALAALDRAETVRQEILPRLERDPSNWSYIRSIEQIRDRSAFERAQILLTLGLFDQAAVEVRRCAEEFPEPNPGQRAYAVLAATDLALAEGRYTDAARLAAEARPTFVPLPDMTAKQIGLQRDRRIDCLRREVAALAKHSATDSGAGARFARLLPEASALLEAPTERLDLAFRAYEVAFHMGETERAREVAAGVEIPADSSAEERALGLALRVDAGEAQPGDEAALRAALDDLVAEWGTLAPRSAGTGWLFSDKRRFVVRVAAEVASRSSDAEALDLVLRALCVSDLGRSLELPVATTDAVRAALSGRGDATLVLWAGDLRGLAFLVTESGVECVPLPGANTLRAPITSLNGLVSPWSVSSRRWSEDWDAASSVLAEALLPNGWSQRVAALDSLTVLGGELLWGVPLLALRVDGVPLGVDVRVRELPDPRFLAREGALPRTVGRSVAWVANVPAAGWDDPLEAGYGTPALPEGVVERVRSAAGDGLRTLFGDAGAVDAIEAGALDGADVGVFYCHGDVLTGVERPSCLYLGGAGDGRLSCAEVEAQDAPDVVILLVCGAGAGPERIGAAVSAHLAGAFFRGGSRTVVVARYDLEATATAELFACFMEEGAKGRTVGEAFRAARSSLAATSLGAHPSSAFGLTVYGDDRLRLVDRRGGALSLGVVLSLAAVALALGAILLGRRPRTTPAA